MKVVVDSRQVLGELFLRLREVVTGRRDDRFRHAQTRRDFYGEAPARRSVDDAVRRRKRVRIEPERRAGDPRGRRSIGLQRVEVRRRDQMRAP